MRNDSDVPSGSPATLHELALERTCLQKPVHALPLIRR